ncbi:MAG: hypothetical protein V1659_04025 [Candidatus Woesearchaeota archaeon]
MAFQRLRTAMCPGAAPFIPSNGNGVYAGRTQYGVPAHQRPMATYESRTGIEKELSRRVVPVTARKC